MLDPPPYRYAFDRPVYLRMLRELNWPRGEADFPSLFGHCVKSGEGEASSNLALGPTSAVRPGTVGVALRVGGIAYESRPASIDSIDALARATASGRGEDGLGEEAATVLTTPAWRFRVELVERSIPYPTAAVSELRDAPVEPGLEPAAAEAEAEVMQCLSRLLELSARLEAAGGDAEEAEAALEEGPAALLRAHEQAVLGGLYRSKTERWEWLGLAACGLVAMPHADAVEALATCCPLGRLRLLLDSLRPALAELDALASLDSVGLGGGVSIDGGGGVATGASAGTSARPSMLGGTTSFSPIEITLGGPAPAGGAPQADEAMAGGTRLEYWYNEELGWLAATVKRAVRVPSGQQLHTLEFDSDGTWEDVALAFDDGARRWRPLR